MADKDIFPAAASGFSGRESYRLGEDLLRPQGTLPDSDQVPLASDSATSADTGLVGETPTDAPLVDIALQAVQEKNQDRHRDALDNIKALNEELRSLRDRVEILGERVYERARRGMVGELNEVRVRVRTRPLTAIALSASAGYLLAVLRR